MIKSAIIYTIKSMPSPEFDVLKALEKLAFVPCMPTQQSSFGWVAPRPDSTALCECINGQLIFKLMIETKKVPADIINRKLGDKCKDIEADTGRKPGKRERREIQEEILQSLLPRAFPSRTAIIAWIDPIGKKLVVGTSSKGNADLIAKVLSSTMDGLTIGPLQTKTAPASAMEDWLLENHTPETLAIEEACELKAEGGTKIKYIKHQLNIQEIKDHLGSMRPASLDLTWLGRVNFTLTDALALKKIDILGNILEGHPEEVDAFDGDAIIATTEINGLIADLVLELDGHPED